MRIIDILKGKVIVSVQAMPNEPLFKEECMAAMMASVVNGGASGLRVAGSRDVKNAKQYNIPVIGLTKPDRLPDNWKDIVYITPTLREVYELIDADADIIAFDGTSRIRQSNCTVADIIGAIHQAGKIALADISTAEEGVICSELGADIISTTLSGYTTETDTQSNEPDYYLLDKLVKTLNKPVFLEGRIWSPSDVKKAFDLGAHSVVIGSAITRPQLITKRFINY